MIILYRLKAGVARDDLESWLRKTDFAVLQNLKHVKFFVTYKIGKRAMSSLPPSVHYAEMYAVPGPGKFVEEGLANPATRAIMEEFKMYADDHEYLFGEPIL